MLRYSCIMFVLLVALCYNLQVIQLTELIAEYLVSCVCMLQYDVFCVFCCRFTLRSGHCLFYKGATYIYLYILAHLTGATKTCPLEGRYWFTLPIWRVQLSDIAHLQGAIPIEGHNVARLKGVTVLNTRFCIVIEHVLEIWQYLKRLLHVQVEGLWIIWLHWFDKVCLL